VKKAIIIVLMLFCVLFVACFDVQSENSVIGAWCSVAYLEYYWDEDITEVGYHGIYEHEVDKYYDAYILNITDSLIIQYERRVDINTGEPISIDTIYTYTSSEDTLYWERYGRYSNTRKYEYFFTEDKHLVMRQSSPFYNGHSVYERHYQKYDHELPPQSWLVDIPDDDYEQDNSIEYASVIRLNVRQDHTITAHDMDYVKFQARAGQGYLIQGLAYFSIELVLLNEEGDTLVSDIHGIEQDFRNLDPSVATAVAWECNESGTYYVKTNAVPHSFLTRTGYYQTKIEKCNIDDIEYWY